MEILIIKELLHLAVYTATLVLEKASIALFSWQHMTEYYVANQLSCLKHGGGVAGLNT